jgi:hypothetical protein
MGFRPPHADEVRFERPFGQDMEVLGSNIRVSAPSIKVESRGRRASFVGTVSRGGRMSCKSEG